MKKLLIIPLLAALLAPISEAAAKKIKLSNPTEVTVTFDSQPRGTRVIVNGKSLGETPLTTKIPVTSINGILPDKTANKNKIEVKFVKDGYVTGIEYIIPKVQFNKSYENGLEFIWPEGVFHEMEAGNTATTSGVAYVEDGSIPAGEAQKVVNRDNPGQTALERTVIRWYFESEPRGARIFWRVISSVPDQVKNTNELWLGNTPFEETRSFNIQGLTYENARDVQIEIKMRRNGYLDQTKRFNVRQAIDQQEISSFFDMIKADE